MRCIIRRAVVLKFLIATLSIASASYGWQQYRVNHPQRKHAMTELTKNVKTACFGRYVLDIPKQSEFSIGNTELNSIKVAYQGKSPSALIFAEKIKAREAVLRAAKHETDGSRLLEALDINDGNSRLFVYREDERDIFLKWVETSVRVGMDEWKIQNDTADEYLLKTKNLVTQLAAQMQFRSMEDIPQTKGACIYSGLIAGSGYERENFTAGVYMESPEFTISIKSETSGPRERGNTLWDRVERAEKDVNEIYGIKLPIGVVRRAEVQVDGRKGQEYVTITPEKGIERFNAKAEIYGDATPKKPTFKIEMDAAWVKNPSKDQKKHMLSKEEALALWDSILKSIRPRPGAF